MAIQRGEIYFVNLSPAQGREQAGHRPVLVISSDGVNRLPLVVSVVVGTKGENISRDYPTNVRVAAVDSGFQWKRYLCVFRFVRLTPLDSHQRLLGESQAQS